MITGAQVREARVLLKWAQWRLAKAAKMSLKVAAKVESVDGVPDVTAARLLSVQTALEEAGVEFVHGDQPAVRLRQVSGA